MVTRSNGYNGTRRNTVNGLANRTDKRVQGLADLHSRRFDTALAVDGAVAHVWNRIKGTTQCTCRGLPNIPDSMAIDNSGTYGTDATVTKAPDTYDVSRNRPVLDRKGKFSYGGETLTVQRKDAHLAKNSIFEPYGSKQNDTSTFTNKLHNQTGDYVDTDNISLDGDSDFDDILTALEAEPKGATNIPGISTTGNSTPLISCPICFGYGTMDSLELYNGFRILLDASTKYDLDLNGSDIEGTQPATFSLYETDSVIWNNVGFPTQWNKVLRVTMFNKGAVVSDSDYSLYFVHPSAPATMNPCNQIDLQAMNNSSLFLTSNVVALHVVSNVDKLMFTHIEILFQLGDTVRVQLPDIEMANDSEYADWNLNSTFELSSHIQLKDSSYIVEGKYRRVWKVTSLNRKLTAAGKSLGYSASVRALHSMEKAFALLNVFGEPIDPFSTIIDDLLEDI